MIPALFLTAPPGSTVVIVSPWVEDVLLRVYRWEGRSGRLEGEQPLSAVMRWLAAERSLRFLLVLRWPDWRFTRLQDAVGPCLEVRKVPELHAKKIITDRLVLRTSANILSRSLQRNVEDMNLEPNPLGDAIALLQQELGRFGIRL